MLRGLMLERVLFNTHNQADRFVYDLKYDLSNAQGELVQKQGSLKIMNTENNKAKHSEMKLKETLKKAEEGAKKVYDKLAQTEK